MKMIGMKHLAKQIAKQVAYSHSFHESASVPSVVNTIIWFWTKNMVEEKSCIWGNFTINIFPFNFNDESKHVYTWTSLKFFLCLQGLPQLSHYMLEIMQNILLQAEYFQAWAEYGGVCASDMRMFLWKHVERV